MSIVQFQMKLHSRDTVTDQFPGLNDCVVHSCQPTIQKIVYGRAKYTSYVMHCQHEDCSRCTDDPGQVVALWNRWNPKKEPVQDQTQHKIHFCAAEMANNRIISNGWQTWGKRRNVLRVMYYEKRHPSAKYFLLEKIGRSWLEAGHYHSLEEAISPNTMSYKRQLTAAPAPVPGTQE